MISVIVPFKDCAEWFGRCLTSLLNQTGDFEFILVNDSSNDNGREIAEGYAGIDERFRVLDNERGAGVSGARNTGIDNAKGEWITFLDADDEMAEGAYDTFMEVLKVDANVHQINHLRVYTWPIMGLANPGGWYSIDNLPKAWFGVWNKIYRRSFLKDIRFKEGLQYGEDGLFVLECLAKDPKIHHAEWDQKTVIHHFDNKDSLSHKKRAQDLLTQVHVYEEFMLRQKKPEVRRAVCLEIGNLWKSERMQRLMSFTS